MTRHCMWASAALLLLTAGCGEDPPQSEAAERAVKLVDPDAVSADALRAVVGDEQVRRFYAAREWQPAWTRETTPGLVEALDGSARHGLDPRDFLGPVEAAQGPTAREAALTRAALDLADALGDGLVDPTGVFEVYTLPRPKLELAAGLSAALAESQVAAWIDGLAPDDAEYRALSEAYVDHIEHAASGAERAIDEGDAIHPGDSDPRVPQIVEVLRANGYLAAKMEPAEGQDAARYSPDIAAAIEKMQDDYGIAADGVIGKGTLELLNTGSGERARTLAVNLERRRWLARNAAATRIDVNTAAAVLTYYRDGKSRDRRRVVVGQPDWETPQLGSPMFRLVANPTWTVPKSIEEDEIAGRGAGYLARNNMVRRDGWIVQQPGPTNALGLVKFDLQNDHAIYLHDTPAKPLFKENQRHFSHGCVRVDDAVGFARLLAQDFGVLREFDKARGTGDETFVKLPEQIPVRLLYHTAFADSSGKVHFRTDPYGWDDRVAEALGYEPRAVRRLQQHLGDVGP
ncbi:MAG: L,D-transpeptidase family protein [Croceibacterium sp.]